MARLIIYAENLGGDRMKITDVTCYVVPRPGQKSTFHLSAAVPNNDYADDPGVGPQPDWDEIARNAIAVV